MLAVLPFRYSALVVALAVAGCATLDQRLRPADEAHPLAGVNWAAVAADNQIEVVAQTGVWPGDPRVLARFEPIRVRIGNYGTRPVHVRYDGLRLVTAGGRSYPPLPPLPIHGALPASRPGSVTPRFTYRLFEAAPQYGRVYSGLATHDGPFLQSTGGAEAGSEPTDPMTPEMVEWALPEGALEVSGHVEGYLFFEIPATATRFQLQAVLVAPRATPFKPPFEVTPVSTKTDRPYKMQLVETVARISIPFVAE